MKSNRLAGKRELGTYFFLYTAVFIFFVTVILCIFRGSQRTFVLMVDGAAQHFPVMCYAREYLRNLFTQGVSTLPMIDFSVGQGFDIIGTLNYYGFGDPLLLFTAFFPEQALEEMYAVMIFLHLYLAGLGFSLFCFQVGKKDKALVLAGTIAYTFCNFVLYGGVKHPCFLNGVLYLPFLLIGVERVISKKGIMFLAVTAGLSFFSNYYFTYVNTALAGIYLLIRLSGSYRELGFKGFFGIIGKLAAAYLWAVCLAGVILLPAVYAFLNNGRSGAGGQGVSLLYQPGYYARTWQGLTEAYTGGNSWNLPGIGCMGILSLIILFVKHPSKEKKLLLAAGVLVFMMCLPAAGSIMNGFSYVTNRWSYGFAFFLALMSIYMLPYLKELCRKERTVILALTGIYCLPLFLIWRFFLPEKGGIETILVILASAVFFLFCGWIWKIWKMRSAVWIITAVAVSGVLWNVVSLYHSTYKNFSSEFLKSGKPMEKLEGYAMAAAVTIEDDDFYRIERHFRRFNESLFTGEYLTSYYYSVVPEAMGELYDSVWLGAQGPLYVVDSLDSRTALMALSSAKYYINEEELSVPYGYKKVNEVKGKDDKTYYLYENEAPLPIGYTYDTVMSRENYEKLYPLEREQALLESTVMEDPQPGMAKSEGLQNGKVITKKVKVTDTHRVNIKNGRIKAKKGGSITLTFEGEPDSETYLVLTGITAEDEEYDGKVKIQSQVGSTDMKVAGTDYQAYWGRGGQALNLGYSQKGQTECTIHFQKGRVYYVKDISIQCVSMERYSKTVQKRKQESLQNVVVSTNRIKGSIQVTTPKILQLSVPYSKGWKLYANGKELKTFVSDLAYTGTYLEPGMYEIEMEYTTPWIIPGAVLSGMGAAGIAVSMIFTRKKRKGEQKPGL